MLSTVLKSIENQITNETIYFIALPTSPCPIAWIKSHLLLTFSVLGYFNNRLHLVFPPCMNCKRNWLAIMSM